MSIDFEPHVERALRDRAASKGISVGELLERTFIEPAVTEPEDSVARVKRLIAEWQRQDGTPKLPPVPTLPGETQTQALRRMWAEEDAKMTDEERDAEDRLWEDLAPALTRRNLEL